MSDETIRDLQARVDQLEGVASDYRLSVALTEQVQRQRRYALLQAAAIVYAGGQHSIRPFPDDFSRHYMSNWHTAESAVTEAEALLAEIEKRETGEGQS